MAGIVEILEEEFSEAFEVKNRKALKRTISLLIENVLEKEYANRQFSEIRSDIKVLAETMQQGFKQIDKRFETVDKRFHEMYHYMDKHFEDLNKRIGFMSWFTPTIVTVLLTLVMAAMRFL